MENLVGASGRKSTSLGHYYQNPQTIVTQTELAGHYVNLTPGCHVIFVTSNNYDHSWIGAPNYNKGGQGCVLYCFSFNSEWYNI